MAATKTTEYVIYRHGSNGANQSMTPVMPIGIYTGEGTTARERTENACRKAAAEHTVYANQYLTAKPVARASGEEYVVAVETQQARQQENAWNDEMAAAATRGNPHPGYACDDFCVCNYDAFAGV